MTALQKYAWFTLVLAIVIGVTAIILVVITDPTKALAAIALLALRPFARRLLGIASWTSLDEREQQLSSRASQIAHGVFWVCFVIGSVAAPMLATAEATIALGQLPIVAIASYLLVTIVREVATLVLLSRG